MGFIFVMELQPLNPFPLIYPLNLSFNICNTLSLELVETFSLQPMSFPYYGASSHVSYDENGIDEFYRTSVNLVHNAPPQRTKPIKKKKKVRAV